MEKKYEIKNSEIEGECKVTKVICLKKSMSRLILNCILCICSLGLFLIAQYWSIRLRVILNYKICSLKEATHVRVFNSDFTSSI
jgi:hypothetical protein